MKIENDDWPEEIECPACEGFGVEDPEMDPAHDCILCSGEGLVDFELGEEYIRLNKEREAKKNIQDFMKNPCCEVFDDGQPYSRRINPSDVSLIDIMKTFQDTGILFFKDHKNDSTRWRQIYKPKINEPITNTNQDRGDHSIFSKRRGIHLQGPKKQNW